MRLDLSRVELLNDERVSRSVANSIGYGMDQIIERATQEKSDWLVNYVKRIFEEEIYPLFGPDAAEKAKEKKEPDEWPLNHVRNFWTQMSKIFNYDFGELEWHNLTNNTPDNAVYFAKRLSKEYIKKFFPDQSKAIGNPAMDLYSLVLKINDKEHSI